MSMELAEALTAQTVYYYFSLKNNFSNKLSKTEIILLAGLMNFKHDILMGRSAAIMCEYIKAPFRNRLRTDFTITDKGINASTEPLEEYGVHLPDDKTFSDEEAIFRCLIGVLSCSYYCKEDIKIRLKEKPNIKMLSECHVQICSLLDNLNKKDLSRALSMCTNVVENEKLRKIFSLYICKTDLSKVLQIDAEIKKFPDHEKELIYISNTANCTFAKLTEMLLDKFAKSPNPDDIKSLSPTKVLEVYYEALQEDSGLGFTKEFYEIKFSREEKNKNFFISFEVPDCIYECQRKYVAICKSKKNEFMVIGAELYTDDNTLGLSVYTNGKYMSLTKHIKATSTIAEFNKACFVILDK